MIADLLLTIGAAGQVCVGLVFLLAAYGKLSHWALLPGVIGNYRLLPDGLVMPAAVTLPAAELVIGVALLSLQTRIAAVFAILLLLVFAVAMAINLRRGRRHIDCGCGQSHLRQQLDWALVARNLLLAALLLPATLTGGSLLLSQAAIAIAAGLTLFLLYLLFNALLTLPGLSPTAQ